MLQTKGLFCSLMELYIHAIIILVYPILCFFTPLLQYEPFSRQIQNIATALIPANTTNLNDVLAQITEAPQDDVDKVIHHLLLVEASVSLDANSIPPHQELDRQEIDEFEPQLTVDCPKKMDCPRGWQLLRNQLITDAPEDLSPVGLKTLNYRMRTLATFKR